MKSSELRIGNITSMGVVCSIEDNFFRVLDSEGDTFKNTWADIQPIPLTEELLLKFGFKHQNKYDLESNLYSKKLKSEYYFTIYSKTETLDFKTKFIGWKVLNIGFDLKIDFIHQLQNLYFALTGEELTIKQQEQ